MRRRSPRRTLQGAVLVFIPLFLMSLYFTGKWEGEWLQRAVLTVTAPPQEAFQWVRRRAVAVIDHYFYLVSVEEENRRLKEELERITFERDQLLERAKEAERLRKLLDFKERVKLLMIPAQVISLSPEPHLRTLVIDKGRRDGVNKGMPVVTWEGVVGRIIAVGEGSSMVLPIVERGATVSVLLQQSRTRAILEGKGWGCRLVYVPRDEEVREGERVITSGLDGIYPKGLPVGRVSRVVRTPREFFLHVEVVPSVDFSRLEEVMVLKEG